MKNLVVFIMLCISFISCYAEDRDTSMKDMMNLLSQGLSVKKVIPINIQFMKKNKYLLFERNAPLNRMVVHYGSEKTKTISTNCVSSIISSNGILQKSEILNNIDMFKITKIYKVNAKYIIVGYEQNLTGYPIHQAAVMQVDSMGKTLWKTIVGEGKSYSEAMVKTLDSGYMIVGHDFIWQSADKSRGNYQVMVSKVDQNGTRIWTKHYSLDGSFAKGRNIEKTNDGGFIIVGETHSKAWIFKIDKLGNKVWETFFDTLKTLDFAYAVNNNFRNGYIILGKSNGTGFGKDKSWIMKVNYLGKVEWSTYFDIGEPCDLQTVNQTQVNEFSITAFLPWTQTILFMSIDAKGSIVSKHLVKVKH